MAKNIKINTKDLSDADILSSVADEKSKLAKMKINHAVAAIENPKQLMQSRRNIARLLTEKRKRELAQK